jgi:arginase
MVKDKLYLLGYASGLAGVDSHTGEAPAVIQQSSFMQDLHTHYQWAAMIHPVESASITESISLSCTELAKSISELTKKHLPFCVVGGDHASAIGTWSGVYDALHQSGDIGLIWIDAHMDSHTPESSESGRIHGMPLACLLGYGYPEFTNILHDQPKIKPENVCLIGVRSFERGEAELLARLNVRIYMMKEVRARGFATVLKEAVERVSAHTIGFGVSLDIDAVDPEMAPGVDVPEPHGINATDLVNALADIVNDPKLIGTEVIEFNPSEDKEQKTEKLMVSVLETIYGGKRTWV